MQKLVAQVLAAWRRAERLATELEPGSPAQRAAKGAADRLRQIYQELTRPGVGREITEAQAQRLLEDLGEDA